MYKIYVKTDDNNKIINANTESFIKDTSEWVEVGEQENRHFRIPIFNEQGIPLYKLADGKQVKRSDAEVETETNDSIQQIEEDSKDITKAPLMLKAVALVMADLTGKTPQEMKTLVKEKYNTL